MDLPDQNLLQHPVSSILEQLHKRENAVVSIPSIYINGNHDNLENKNSKSSKVNEPRYSEGTDAKHKPTAEATTFGESLTTKLTATDDKIISKVNNNKQSLNLTTESAAFDVIQNSNFSIKERRNENFGSDTLRPVTLRNKRKTLLHSFKRRSLPPSFSFSTVSTISSELGQEALNRFLYSELMYSKMCVSNCSLPSDCSCISQSLNLSTESLSSRKPKSFLPTLTYLREVTEAHSAMLAQLQHYQHALDKSNIMNNLVAEDISEISLINKRGAICIAGCKLDFPEGSFETAVYVKLSCFFPLQVSCCGN